MTGSGEIDIFEHHGGGGAGHFAARIIKNLGRRRGVIWFVPGFHELMYTGRHRYSPVGILDRLMPFIDSGAITIIGEVRPASFEKMRILAQSLDHDLTT